MYFVTILRRCKLRVKSKDLLAKCCSEACFWATSKNEEMLNFNIFNLYDEEKEISRYQESLPANRTKLRTLKSGLTSLRFGHVRQPKIKRNAT